MKNQLIEEINNFRRLSGILIKESGGEKALADLLIGRLVKSGEKSLPKEIGSFTTKNGVKSVLNVDAYKNLLTKSVLSTEEKDVLHTINKNIVREFGVDIFVDAIKAVTKNMGTLEAIALENKILKEFFDTSTANTLKSSLNIGQLKPETPVDDVGPVVRWADDINIDVTPPPIVNQFIEQPMIERIEREFSDFVSGNLDYNTISRISMDDLNKMNQIQKLTENQKGLELLAEKNRLQKKLAEEQLEIAKLKKEEAALDLQLKKDANNLELKSKKQELRLKSFQIFESAAGTVNRLKWFIIVGLIILFGVGSALTLGKKVLFGDGVLGGDGKSSGGSGKPKLN